MHETIGFELSQLKRQHARRYVGEETAKLTEATRARKKMKKHDGLPSTADQSDRRFDGTAGACESPRFFRETFDGSR